jgi:hypothetical protein
LLDSLRGWTSADGSLVHVPGGRPSRHGELSDGLEGFARSLMLAAFRLAGSGGAVSDDLADRYLSGLVAGVRGSWPRVRDRAQSGVEAGAVAIALAEARPWLWDVLDERERDQVADWLGAAGRRPWPNNRLLFSVVRHAFLKSVGAPYDARAIDVNLARVERLHHRGGWYSDGPGRRFDHYCAWGFHPLLLLWCRLDGDVAAPERASLHRRRAAQYLADYRLLFGAEGAPVYHGRSLLYRWATVAPFWAAELAGASAIPPGETRRLASGALRTFLERGAVRDGVLTMGWHSEFLPIAQTYSGPASPYWSSLGFLGLVLPPDHPVWTETEQPLAVEQAAFARPLAPGVVAAASARDGIVRLTTHGRGDVQMPGLQHSDPHYRKLAYSSHTAPETAGGGCRLDLDAQVSLSPRLRRRRTRPLRTEGTMQWSRTGRIRTVSVLRPEFELRAHRVRLARGVLRTGGFAVASDSSPAIRVEDRWSLAHSDDGVVSFIAGLHGFDASDVARFSGGNAFGANSAVPFLRGRAPGLFAAIVVLATAPFDPLETLASVGEIAVGRDALEVVVGDERVVLRP